MISSTHNLDHLLANLRSSDPEVRRRTARVLGQLGEDQAIPPLLDLLADQEQAVAEDAARALAQIRGREVAARLVPLLSVEQVRLRNRAMELLRRLGTDAPDLILDILEESDPDLRIFAADILGHIQGPGVGKALVRALDDPDPNVRTAAAMSLGRRRDGSAVRALVSHLDDDPWVAFTVTQALAQIGDPAAVEPLIRLISQGPDHLQAAAVDALGRLGDARAVPHLLAAAGRVSADLLEHLVGALLSCADPTVLRRLDPQVREKVVLELMDDLEDSDQDTVCRSLEGLAVLGDASATYGILNLVRQRREPRVLELAGEALCTIGLVAPLLGAVADPDEGVARFAAQVLGRLGGDKAQEALCRALAHHSPRVRRQAARSLGELAAQEALPHLIKRLQDNDDLVVVEAATALGRLGRPQAVPGLSGLLAHDREPVRRAALQALLAIGGDRVRRVLVEGTTSPRAQQRSYSAQGLGRLGGVAESKVLGRLLRDPEARVRKAAVEALLELESGPGLEQLETVLNDPDPGVRRALIKGLGRSRRDNCQRLLIMALDDPDLALRLEAVAGLERVGDLQALEALAGLLADHSSSLKIGVARALGSLGSRQACTHLIQLLQDQDPQVRAAADQAIQKLLGGW